MGDGRGVADTLTAGPKWLLNRNVADPECFIVALTNETFLTSDGGKILKRWNWPAGGGWADDNASWSVRERIASAPLVLPAAAGKPARMLVADATGGIWLYALDRSDSLLRRWIPGKTLALPGGKVSPQFGVQVDSAGRQLAAYTVSDKKIVCLDVDADEPRWVAAMKDDAASNIVGTPYPAADGRWLITDLGGRVSILNAESGQPELTREVGLPGAVPATAGHAHRRQPRPGAALRRLRRDRGTEARGEEGVKHHRFATVSPPFWGRFAGSFAVFSGLLRNPPCLSFLRFPYSLLLNAVASNRPGGSGGARRSEVP